MVKSIFLTMLFLSFSKSIFAEDVSIDKCRTNINGKLKTADVVDVKASDLLPITPQNFEAYRKSILTIGKTYLSSETKALKLGDRYEVSPKLPKFMLLRISEDGVYEMRGFGADRRFFKAQVIDGKIEWTGVEEPLNPKWEQSLPLETKKLQIPKIDVMKMDREKLVQKIAANAGEASRTVQNKQAVANEARAKAAAQGLVNAADYIVKMIEKKENFTLKKLEQLHSLVANGTIQTSNGDLGLGILRGSTVRCVKSGLKYVFAYMGQTSVRMGEQSVMSYTAPQDVSKTLQGLLDRINKITPTSSPDELSDIYTKFLSTHPFIDGNGRTSRMLVQYMQMKMKVDVGSLNEDAAFRAFYLKPSELSHVIFKKPETQTIEREPSPSKPSAVVK